MSGSYGTKRAGVQRCSFAGNAKSWEALTFLFNCAVAVREAAVNAPRDMSTSSRGDLNIQH